MQGHVVVLDTTGETYTLYEREETGKNDQKSIEKNKKKCRAKGNNRETEAQQKKGHARQPQEFVVRVAYSYYTRRQVFVEMMMFSQHAHFPDTQPWSHEQAVAKKMHLDTNKRTIKYLVRNNAIPVYDSSICLPFFLSLFLLRFVFSVSVFSLFPFASLFHRMCISCLSYPVS